MATAAPLRPDKIVAIESRGFLFGAPLSLVAALDGVVAGCMFVIELEFLAGRQRLAAATNSPAVSLVSYA